MDRSEFVKAQLVLPVQDMETACAWYNDVLGFETVYLHADPVDDPEGNYAILKRDRAEVHLILEEDPQEHAWTTAGTGYLFLIVKGVDSVYKCVESRGIEIEREMSTESWGARAFQLVDPSGNLILVAEG